MTDFILKDSDLSEIDHNIYYTDVELHNLTEYSTRISIGGLYMIANISYNSRLNRRYLSISSSSGDVLLPNTQLNVNNNYDLNINSEIIGYVVVVKFGTLDRRYDFTDFLNWNGKCILQITHYSIDVEDTANKYVLDLLIS